MLYYSYTSAQKIFERLIELKKIIVDIVQVVAISFLADTGYFFIKETWFPGMETGITILTMLGITIGAILSLFSNMDENRFRSVSIRLFIYSLITILSWFGLLSYFQFSPKMVDQRYITECYIAVVILISLIVTDIRGHSKA